MVSADSATIARRDEHDENVEANTAEANSLLESRTEGGKHAEHAAEVESGGVDEEEVGREALDRLLKGGRPVSAAFVAQPSRRPT